MIDVYTMYIATGIWNMYTLYTHIYICIDIDYVMICITTNRRTVIMYIS